MHARKIGGEMDTLKTLTMRQLMEQYQQEPEAYKQVRIMIEAERRAKAMFYLLDAGEDIDTVLRNFTEH